MKITVQHYNYLKEKMKNTILNNIGFTNTENRFAWDCLWNSVPSQWVCDNLYPYLNDENIESALKKIVKETQQKV